MREIRFLIALWKANLLSAMEYRAAFISQVVGMILNNGMYFLFWVVFFNRFKEVKGWGLNDMFLLFGVVAAGFGLAAYLFGNTMSLAEVIANGGLDYFLSLPRPVLLHLAASRSTMSGLGDLVSGIICFLFADQLSAGSILRFVLGSLSAMLIFLSFLILVQSLAFWMGNATMLSRQAFNALITFAMYPITLFDGSAKFLLFTLIPAALIGAVPAEFVRSFSIEQLALLAGASAFFLGSALVVFSIGLRRYESGSAIQNQV